MLNKKIARMRRARKVRARINRLGVTRLSVHRSGRHFYAQIIAADNGRVLASASTLQKDVREGLSSTSSKAAAAAVGKAIAERGKLAGVEEVAFDRSGFAYHGCIKELADAAREAGLKF